MNLALIDNNAANLSKAKESFQHGSETETYTMDVSKIDEWKDLKGKIEKKFKSVDFVMLNAGIGLKSGWEDVEYFHKVINTLFPPLLMTDFLDGRLLTAIPRVRSWTPTSSAS